MTNTEGFLLVILLLGAVWTFLGLIPLIIAHEILIRIKNRILTIAIPILVAALGCFVFLDAPTSSSFLLEALVFSLPMAVLLPLFVLPGWQIKTRPGFYRVTFCYLLVSVFGCFVALTASSDTLRHSYSASSVQLMFAVTFFLVFFVETAGASFVYIMMEAIHPSLQDISQKPE
jgi:hypothetical protein